jgi:hypothetical protein
VRNLRQAVILGTITLPFLFLVACNLLPSQVTSGEKQLIESPAPDKFTIVRLDYSNTPLNHLLKSEVQKAKAQGGRPYLEFYADWCPASNALGKNLGDKLMVDAFTGTYIIQLNLDEWKSKLTDIGFVVHEIPMFFELDAEGKPTGRKISGGAWGENIPENMAPPLKEFFHTK